MMIRSLEDDGGSEVIAIEEGSNPQALWVRVGRVYRNGILDTKPVIWISYQPEYLASDLSGPLMLETETWRLLNRFVRRKLHRARTLNRYLTRTAPLTSRANSDILGEVEKKKRSNRDVT